MTLDKVNEIIVAGASAVLGICLWVFKRMFKSIDIAHDRIDKLESKLVDRVYLENQLSPIRQDLNLILKHLLEQKKP